MKPIYTLITLFLMGVISPALTQGFKMHLSTSFADCFGAVEVMDFDQPSKVQFPGNYGMRDDFIGLDPDFHEVNSVWLRLEPHLEGELEFEIETENNVDFSYFLFKANDNQFCDHLENDKVQALVHQSTSYKTKGVKAGGGEGYEKSVEAQPDDIFYLMIHTNSTYKGEVKVTFKRKGQIQVTQSVIQDFRTKKDGPYVRVRIRDRETGNPVAANMVISGVKYDNYLFMGTDFYFDATTAKLMQIESNTRGYFLFYKQMETRIFRNKNLDILLNLEKLAPGKKLALENIKFEQDSDRFLNIAYPALKRLLDFMAVNSATKVEIQGHVNAPGYKNTAKIKGLSEDRAKAVRDFLKDNGIDSRRMQVKGYGNTAMLYEEPESEEEAEANRRVEIKIIE